MHSAEEKTITRAENKGSLPKLGREGCPEEVILAEAGRVTRSWLGEKGGAFLRERHMLGWSRASRG